VARTDTPRLDLDLWSEEVLHDPWPHYRALRDAGPAVHLEHELYDVYAVGRYEDGREALRHWELFSSAQGVGFNDLMNEAMQGTIVGADPPEHDRLRGVMLDRLKLSEVRELTAMVQGKADALVAELLERGQFDAVTDLAERLVPVVVGELVGISGEVLDRFAHGGDKFFTVAGPPNQRMDDGFPVVLELLQLIGSLTKDDMAPGSMGWDLYDAADRGEIPEEMCTTLIWNYVGPGFDTTINALGSTIWMLARDPEQWKALKAEPSLVPGVVNEGLRMESPIQTWTGSPSPAGRAWPSCSARPTAMSVTIPIPIISTSTAIRPTTSPSARASTSVSAPHWPGPRSRPPSTPWSDRSAPWSAAIPSGGSTTRREGSSASR
jgi:cytochrome P450